MRRSPRLRALLGLGASLALVWAASAAVLWGSHAPGSRLEARYAQAERLVFYRLEPGEVLRVPLPEDTETLRLTTHLRLPLGVTYSPERQYVYGLELRLVGPQGEELLHRPLFTRTRQSKAEPVDGQWLRESAFTVDPTLQLTDERGFLLSLPPHVRARPAVLHLRYPGPHGSLLVRMYARSWKPSPALLSGSRQEAALRRAEAQAQRATFLPWEKLSLESRRALAEERWRRLGVEGEAGQDYRIETVYRTDFRLPLVEAAESTQERLEARGAVALNVVGPAKLLLRLWRPPPGPLARTPAPLSLRRLGEDGTRQEWSLPAPGPGEISSHPLELPAGRHTLTLHNPGEAPLRYALEGPSHAWLAPSRLQGPLAAPLVAFLPDVYRSEAYVSGPGCPAVELELGAQADELARLLRVEARSLGDTPGPATFSLDFLDERGRTLGDTRMELPSESAPFERAELPPLPPRRLPCEPGTPQPPSRTAEVTNRPVPVSLPASVRLFLPEGTRRVRLHASHPTAFELFSFLYAPGGSEHGEPYLEEGLRNVRWRNAPLERRNWHPLRPANAPALTRRGARVELRSQVHLEPLGPPGPSRRPSGEALSLTPAGSVVSRQLLEPLAEDFEPEGEARTAFSLLAPGRPVRLHFDARAPARPELRLGLSGAEGLGSEVELLLDGEPVVRSVLRTTRARELLPPVPPGEHEVLLRASTPGLTATLNRPPAPGSQDAALRARTVYRLDGPGLRIPVLKRSTRPVTVNLVLFGASPEASPSPRVAVTIDGGRPRRRVGVPLRRLTRASRELALPPSERPPASFPAQPQARWHGRTLSVTLGEDLSPGLHWIHVKPRGSGPLWARFFMYGSEEGDETPRQWNRRGWELEDAP